MVLRPVWLIMPVNLVRLVNLASLVVLVSLVVLASLVILVRLVSPLVFNHQQPASVLEQAQALLKVINIASPYGER